MSIYLWISSKTKEAKRKLENLDKDSGKKLIKDFLDNELKNKLRNLSDPLRVINEVETNHSSNVYKFAQLLANSEDNRKLFKEAIKNQAESAGTNKKGLFNALIWQRGNLDMENLNKSKIKAFLLARHSKDSVIEDSDITDEDDKRSHRIKNEDIVKKLKSGRLSNILKVFMALVLWDLISIIDKKEITPGSNPVPQKPKTKQHEITTNQNTSKTEAKPEPQQAQPKSETNQKIQTEPPVNKTTTPAIKPTLPTTTDISISKLLPQDMAPAIFAIKEATKPKENSVNILSEASQTVSGTLSFYGAQRFDEQTKKYRCCVIIRLKVSKTIGEKLGNQPIISRHIDGDIPDKLNVGNAILSLNRDSLVTDIENRSHLHYDGDYAYIINVFDATLTKTPALATPNMRIPDGIDTVNRILKDFGFKMGKSLGSGGYGSVYDCGEHVLKIIKATSGYVPPDDQGDALIEDVIKSLDIQHNEKIEQIKRSLSDPHFLRILSDDWKKSFNFVVMKKSDQSWAEISFKGADKNKQDFKHKEMKKAILSIASTLNVLHQKGVAHFDIKPDNVGWSGHTRSPSTLTHSRRSSSIGSFYALFDFGTASLTVSSRTQKKFSAIDFFSNALEQNFTPEQFANEIITLQDQLVKGTPQYMAPEISSNLSQGTVIQRLTTLSECYKKIYDNVVVKKQGDDRSTNNSVIESILNFEDKKAFDWLNNLLSIGRKADIYSFGATIIDKVLRSFNIHVRPTVEFNLELFDEKLYKNSEFETVCNTDDMKNLRDLLEGMMKTNPAERFDINQVIAHKYLH